MSKEKINKIVAICNETNCLKRCCIYTGSSLRLEEHLNAHHDIKKPTAQKNLPKAKSDDYANFKYLILMFIVTAGLSYRSVENKYFKELLSFVSQNPANYAHPSRRALKNVAKAEVADEKKVIKEQLKTVEDVAITADGWTSTKQKMGYIAVTVHFFVKGMILKSISLGVKRVCGSHNAETLAEAIKSMCEDFNIFSKVRSMTGDNATYMINAAKILKIPYISCFAHVLNRVIVTTLKNLKINFENGDGNELISKCRKLVGGFNHSTQLTEKLLEDQRKSKEQSQASNEKLKHRCLRLIQDVITRWNSLFLMLIRIIKLKDSIRRVLNLQVLMDDFVCISL